MKNLYLFTICGLFLCYNTVLKGSKLRESASIRCIKISNPFPLIGLSGEVIKYDSSDMKIYYYQDQIMTQEFTHYGVTNGKEERKVYYNHNSFVFTKGKKYGLFNDTTLRTIDKVVSVDSMLLKEKLYFINYEEMFEKMITGLIESSKTQDGIEELYWFKDKNDTTSTGTLRVCYSKSKLKGIDFSISKKLEEQKKGMKIIKAATIYNGRFVKEYNANIGTIENVYTVEEIPVNNASEIIQLFEKERKMSLN